MAIEVEAIAATRRGIAVGPVLLWAWFAPFPYSGYHVKSDQKDWGGRSVLKECVCATIDCLYDYVGS